MKYLLIFLVIFEIILLAVGGYFEITGNQSRADLFLGSFTLILFIIVIPLFLYWRLKDRDLSRYHLNRKK